MAHPIWFGYLNRDGEEMTLKYSSKESLDAAIVPQAGTIYEAIEAIDKSGLRIAIVVDANRVIEGVITDGDIRRGTLNNHSLSASVTTILNRAPVVGNVEEPPEELLERMDTHDFQSIPLVDSLGRLCDVVRRADLREKPKVDNPVVILAGGLGTRLRPYTEKTPKPMLKVGGRPLLEWQITQLVRQGFRDIHISVNFHSEQIIEHFGDGSAFGCRINYLEEDLPLGTAGPLSGLPDLVQPALVLNGDILTQLNFTDALKYHEYHGASMTVCAKCYEFTVPFGVIEAQGNVATRVVEKPTYSTLVSAGIYVVNPGARDFIPYGTRLDIPDLMNDLIEAGKTVSVFPIHEEWLDVGRPADLELAQYKVLGFG